MKLIKQSLKTFKEKFFQLFILQFVFFFSNFFFLTYFKNKLSAYLVSIEQYSLQLSQFQAELANQEVNPALETLIAEMQSSTTKAIFFGFVLVPVITLALWVFFQSKEWKLLKEKIKISTTKYIVQFTIITIIGVALFSLVLTNIIKKVVTATPIDIALIVSLLLLFLVYAATTSIYAHLGDHGFFKTLKESLKHLIKIKSLFILFLCFITSLSLLYLFAVLFTSYWFDKYFFLSPIGLIAYMLILTVVSLWFKTVFSLHIKKE